MSWRDNAEKLELRGCEMGWAWARLVYLQEMDCEIPNGPWLHKSNLQSNNVVAVLGRLASHCVPRFRPHLGSHEPLFDDQVSERGNTYATRCKLSYQVRLITDVASSRP